MKPSLLLSAISALLVLVMSSCGTFFSVGGGVAANNGSYDYYDYTRSATPLSLNGARRQALFLTDKMAYELGLNTAQYEAAYEINLDYLLRLRSSNDLYGTAWTTRNRDLGYVLTAYQYSLYTGDSYFYRPVYWQGNNFRYSIYSRYQNPDYLYYNQPQRYATYKGRPASTSSRYRNFSGTKKSTPLVRRDASGQSNWSKSQARRTQNSNSQSFGGRATSRQTGSATSQSQSSNSKTFGGRTANTQTNRQSAKPISPATTSQQSGSTTSGNRNFGGRSGKTNSSSPQSKGSFTGGRR